MVHQYHLCFEACIDAARKCEHCADACLNEAHVKSMAECIRLDRDCAAICWTAAGFMSRGSHYLSDICRVCADICEACAAECQRHSHEHCQSCADACHRCADICRRIAGVMV